MKIFYCDEKTMMAETKIKVNHKDSWILENGVEVKTKSKNGRYPRVDKKPGYAFTDEKTFQAYVALVRIGKYMDQLNKSISTIGRLSIPEDKRDFLIKAYRKLERICSKL